MKKVKKPNKNKKVKITKKKVKSQTDAENIQYAVYFPEIKIPPTPQDDRFKVLDEAKLEVKRQRQQEEEALSEKTLYDLWLALFRGKHSSKTVMPEPWDTWNGAVETARDVVLDCILAELDDSISYDRAKKIVDNFKKKMYIPD